VRSGHGMVRLSINGTADWERMCRRLCGHRSGRWKQERDEGH
jgi:hypothetical protein